MLPPWQTVTIAGLCVHVYACPESTTSSGPVVIFLLHGRLGSAKKIEPVAKSLVQLAHEPGQERELLVVTFVRQRFQPNLSTSECWPGSTKSWNPPSRTESK
jgi:hypothetical protein